MVESEAVERHIYESQRVSDARTTLLRTLSRFEGSSAELEDAVALATAPESFTDPAARERLVERVARVEPKHLPGLFREWLEAPSIYLHMLIPPILMAVESPSRELVLQVLEAGIDYPDPSLNRDFVEAGARILGRRTAIARLLERTDGVAAAYYWLLSLPGGDEVDGESAALERELRRRLRHWTRYLRPWWRPW